MAGRGGGSKSSSLYAVLGVASDCSDAELRSAYRKLAMVGDLGPDSVIALCLLGVSSSPKWHPDKCAGAGSSAGSADAAKARFQKIQGAYAVLSDPNKRILYDVEAYDGEGDDDGAGEILGDILEAMSQAGPADNGKRESLEDLQRQFEELFLRPSPSSFSPNDAAGKSASTRRPAGRK
ncbi:unnamed protein product [Miscanthus lutarioriparius]|uniref:J domain-containing protein n=1 Tax=Miscanthus lutarioriparius TaxID=422564 RepID=A0A811PIW3_9POAL|nr:unnamed protein product [Miscanthus lutarioriparius]